jgi:hypothetical protein
MARCRLPAAVAICAALLAACAEGGVTVAASSTTTLTGREEQPTSTTVASSSTITTLGQPAPITFTLGIDDDGLRLRLRPGDEVVLRLPVAGVTDIGWVVLVAPNPAVLAGGDDILWGPSEVHQGGLAFHEFYFIAAGPGQTTVTLTRAWQEFTFTVVVSAYQ